VLTGLGIFGWTATQVHEKIVARQLCTIFQVVLQFSASGQEDLEARAAMEGGKASSLSMGREPANVACPM
jgi:hypothetical protein